MDTAAGVGHLCPVCGQSSVRFGPGPGGRANASCPHCGSLERHRLVAFVVRGAAPLLAGASALQVGPAGASTPILTGTAPHVSAHTVDGQTRDHRLPFADDSFDLAVCTQVFDGTEDPEAVARELARVLRTGGVAVLYDSVDVTPQLEAAGLAASRVKVGDLVGPEVARIVGLAPGDAVAIARAWVNEPADAVDTAPSAVGPDPSAVGRQVVADWLGAALVSADRARAAAARDNEILSSRLTALEASLVRRAERAERAASGAQSRYDALRSRLPVRIASGVHARAAALRAAAGGAGGGPRGGAGGAAGSGAGGGAGGTGPVS